MTIPEAMKALMLPEDMEIEGKIKMRVVETPAERSHRLRMKVRDFWVKEAPVHLAAIEIAVSVTGLALFLAIRPSSSDEDKKWSWSNSLLIAVAGFAFGKAAK